MSKKVVLIGLAVVVVAALVVANFMMETNGGTEVKAAKVELSDIEEVVSASGRIQPKTKVDITSQINGEIIDLRVREGDRVQAGQLLVVLDTVQLRSDLDRAQYSVNEVSARLEGAEANLEQARDEYERQQRLFDRQLTSETAYKNAKYAFTNTKATFEATKAQAQQFQAAYEKQLDNLKKAKIVAPMDGVLSYLDCEVGEIAAAQTAFTQGKTLMTISNLSVFEVEVEVDETEIAKVELNQPAEIEVDAFPDSVFTGKVVEIGNTATTSTLSSSDQSTNFRVKVVFAETDLRIRPGMSATVDITTARRENVMSLPFASIVMRSLDPDSLARAQEGELENGDAESAGVTAVHAAEMDDDTVRGGFEDVEREELKGVFAIRDGKAVFLTVETGVADQKNIEIVSGVEVGDSVISGPYRVLRTVKQGDEVHAAEQKKNGDK